MLATKISFMNELANIAERVGADIEKVRVGIGSDPRIGYSFIYPGVGYGGSCFRRTCRRSSALGARSGLSSPTSSKAVEAVNNRQKEVLVTKLRRHFGADAEGRDRSRCGAWPSSRTPTTCARRRRSHDHRQAVAGR